MEYQIYGTTMPVVECSLRLGEELYCQTGAMKWRDSDVRMRTGGRGGMRGLFGRIAMGQTAFLNKYTADRDRARVAFGHSFPGTILAIDVARQPVNCMTRNFLACEATVEQSIGFQSKLGVGAFGGRGFVMQRLQGAGVVFVELDGESVAMRLAEGESVCTETGALAMYEEGVSINVERVRGGRNVLFGGEGLFVTTATGPGKIWIQTMDIQHAAAELKPFLSTKSGK